MKWEAGRRGLETLGGREVGGTSLGVGGWEELRMMIVRREQGRGENKVTQSETIGTGVREGDGGQGRSVELAWVAYCTLSFAHLHHYDTWSKQAKIFPLCSLLFSFSFFSGDWEAGRFDLKTLRDWEAGWGR